MVNAAFPTPAQNDNSPPPPIVVLGGGVQRLYHIYFFAFEVLLNKPTVPNSLNSTSMYGTVHHLNHPVTFCCDFVSGNRIVYVARPRVVT